MGFRTGSAFFAVGVAALPFVVLGHAASSAGAEPTVIVVAPDGSGVDCTYDAPGDLRAAQAAVANVRLLFISSSLMKPILRPHRRTGSTPSTTS